MIYDHKTQVGGTHYSQGDKPQHWDLVLMYNWDYFQAQVIKYLMRWKYKYEQPEKRLEDLKKARNFLDKYIAEEERKLVAEKMECEAGNVLVQGPAFIGSNEYWSNEGFYGDSTQLYKCRHCKSLVRTSVTPPPHGCTQPQAAAAAQDAGWPPLEVGDQYAGAVVGSGSQTIFQTDGGCP